MKEKLFVCSSSLLIEAHQLWDDISKSIKIEFCSYGDYISPLLQHTESTIMITLFFEDLYSSEKSVPQNLKPAFLC